MDKKKSIFRYQKKYIAFFTIVSLLCVFAFIKGECPICEGTGSISSTGMDRVVIRSTDFSLQTVSLIEGCFYYRVYFYDVVMTLQNHSELGDAAGYIRLGLIDYTTGKIITTQYSMVEVPAGTQVENSFSVVFAVNIDSPTSTIVTAEVVTSNVPCKACNGTGRVALNYLPLLDSMKKTFTEVQRLAVTPIQPAEIRDIPEEYIGEVYDYEEWIGEIEGQLE